MLPQRWLILADDLTGAADCAIAFARRGLPASVAWRDDAPDDAVLAIDAESRQLSAFEAAARHRALLAARHRPGVAYFKKLDSTLRGQPAAEIAECARFLREGGHGALAVLAPAFPATGRTTEAGRIRLQGEALEDSALWQRDHSYPDADLVAMLRREGLRAELLGLDAVRGGAEALRGRVAAAAAAGLDAVVCDAVTAADLELIARATVPLSGQLFWAGSGGLAQALAGCGEGAPPRDLPPAARGGALLVVGSVAETSRAGAALLAADGAVLMLSVAPDTLREGEAHPAWRRAAADAAEALARGEDVLVQIEAGPGLDLAEGAALARRLATLLRPAASDAGALFATGGETALALLDALGVTGIRLVDEIEPGVPLGITCGALAVPVVTKAGAFGDAGTLGRCLSHLRRSRRTEFPA